MKDSNCPYCMKGKLVGEFGIEICELPTSVVYLFKEQSHSGRIIVAHKEHVGEIVDLSEEERNLFIKDVNYAASAIHKLFHPQKMNYGAYGDKGHHLHFHLVPKYENHFEWGETFEMNPAKRYLSELEYNILVEKIKNEIVDKKQMD